MLLCDRGCNSVERQVEKNLRLTQTICKKNNFFAFFQPNVTLMHILHSLDCLVEKDKEQRVGTSIKGIAFEVRSNFDKS